MREIKFRVWWKNRMFEVAPLDELVFKDGCYFTHSGTTEPYVFMQYTGLKDKNGREIYEGDIVKHRGCNWNRDERIDSVWFQKGAFTCGWMWDDGNNDWWSIENTDDIEVIGNIYENPELITKP